MNQPQTLIRRIGGWLRGQRGASLVEYALLVALIAVVSISAITLVGRQALTSYDCAATEIDNPGIRQAIAEKIKNGDVLDKLEARFAESCN